MSKRSKMSKDPAFLFYSSDFLVGTYSMSYEQKGKYISLMCLQHQKGHLSERLIKQICNDNDENILEKFVQDEDGNYYNVRLEEEIAIRTNYSNSRRANRQGKKAEEPDYTESFNEFYSLYPKKVAKQHALKAYIKRMKEGIEPETIISGLRKYLDFISNGGIKTQYIKHPATWLNSEGWADEYTYPANVGFY